MVTNRELVKQRNISTEKVVKTKVKRKLVCRKGVNDADYPVCRYESFQVDGKQKKRLIWMCPFYCKWSNMLIRCYSENLPGWCPTYADRSVCDEWLYFSNFKAWMEQQDWEGKQLDKDLLVPGNKVYSPQTCVFVSQVVNTFLTERASDRGDYPIGVSLDKGTGKFKSQCRNPFTLKKEYLGSFLCEEGAHNTWLEKKLEHAKALAALQTDERVATALITRYENYKEYNQN